MIDNNREREPALDFEFLRARGIELIQQLSGKNWSDFNLHDPGITILEYLCYALTDVAYRTTFPIADILANSQSEIDRQRNFFLPKAEILSGCPITVSDFRKFIIDQNPAVDDVWLEPIKSSYAPAYVKGFYKVIIKPAEAERIYQLAQSDLNAAQRLLQEIEQSVRKLLLENRVLGENYVAFQVLQPQPVYILADVIVDRSASPEDMLIEILNALEQTINPPVAYHTEAELQQAGYAIEDIYQGPLLKNGIIRDIEPKKRKKALDPFFLIKAIAGIKGVTSIKKLLVSTNGKDYSQERILFGEQDFPFVITNEENPDITLYHNNYPLFVRKQDVIKKEQQIKKVLQKAPGTQQKPAKTLTGAYKSIQEYVSFQTLFPAIYGINEPGAKANQSPAAIAQTRQLKAYLMLFEQLLANSLSQLANISDLFSLDTAPAAASTYAFQPLYQVPDASYILKAFTNTPGSPNWEHFKNNPENGYITALKKILETNDQYKDRKKRAYDHMLARFNIALREHPLFLYAHYYEPENSAQRNDLEISWKANILRHLNVFTASRVKADNYLTSKEDEDMEKGFGKKMSLLLYIKNGTRRKLSRVMEKHQEKLTVTHPQNKVKPISKRLRHEELDIEFDQEEPEDTAQTFEPGPALNHQITFKRQTQALFQFAIDPNNYRILSYQTNSNPTAVLWFKNPLDTQWNRLSEHHDEFAALQAQKQIIQTFKEINIQSEGFYVLEHVLLTPPFPAPQRGFNFLDCSGNILARQQNWQTFPEREKTIETLLHLAKKSKDYSYPDLVNQLEKICTLTKNPGGQHSNQNLHERDAVDEILTNLNLLKFPAKDFYPAFEYTINLQEGLELPEDFFNYQMTIVLPSWPARFQDKSFRHLAEEMFREESPAHLKVSFLWLSLTQMRLFDDSYFAWLEALKEDSDSSHAQTLALDLTRFILTHTKQQKTHIPDEAEA